ncbi:MAG: DUF58 domain-containing protein [Defluviitaleaceae bacterium]|nr:DUF58 domain-containing protein [Defluviitaleaceae bacterium]
MIPLIIILIAVVIFVQIRSMEDPLKGIEFDYHSTKLLVEPDEEFDIITTLTNTKRRFVPFIKLDQAFPKELLIKDAAPTITSDARGYNRYIRTLYIMPRSKYIKRETAILPERGRYIFQGAYLRGGDFMGFNDQLKKYSILREVVVYPKTVPTGDIEIVMGGIMGDISVRRLVMEDPILVVGFREYSGREPMKAISWNHSARVGKLMVKQFDHTIDPAISVVLDVEGKGLEGDGDKKEFAFSAARTVCQSLEDKGMKYDFLTNATTADSFMRWSYLTESIGAQHFATIMEGLGRATHTHVESFSTLCENFVQKRLYDRFVILITIKDRADTAKDIAYIEANNGGKVFVISAPEHIIGGEPADESGIFSETAV